MPQTKIGPQIDRDDFNRAKLKQFKLKKCHTILREIFFNIMFIWVLSVVCFSTRNQNSYFYKEQMTTSFLNYKIVQIFSFFKKFNFYIFTVFNNERSRI